MPSGSSRQNICGSSRGSWRGSDRSYRVPGGSATGGGLVRTAGGGRREIRLCVLSVLYFCLSEFRPFSAILYASSLCVSLSPLPLSVVLWHRFLDGYSDKAPFFVCRRYYRRYSYFIFLFLQLLLWWSSSLLLLLLVLAVAAVLVLALVVGLVLVLLLLLVSFFF